MKTFFCIALLFVVAAVASGAKVQCFKDEQKIGDDQKPFSAVLEWCIGKKDKTEAEIETYKCIFNVLKITRKGQVTEAFSPITTDEFSANAKDIYIGCDNDSMDELAKCMNDKLSPLCNDDDKYNPK